MLGITRWTAWTELAGVHRDLDSLFNRVFGDTVRSQSVDDRGKHESERSDAPPGRSDYQRSCFVSTGL
jgi:hypothetical protein